MNITLSIGEQLVRRARRFALAMGKTLNQLVREHLVHLTAQDDGRPDVEEFRRLSREARGQSRGWKLDRDELRERS